MFVCSLHIPERDLTLTMNLAHPDGRKIRLRGVIVRSYRVAPSMRRARRSGFCVRLIEAPEDYFVLVAELLHLQLPDEQLPDDELPCELPDEQHAGEQLPDEQLPGGELTKEAE